jgi:hypothetical protein
MGFWFMSFDQAAKDAKTYSGIICFFCVSRRPGVARHLDNIHCWCPITLYCTLPSQILSSRLANSTTYIWPACLTVIQVSGEGHRKAKRYTSSSGLGERSTPFVGVRSLCGIATNACRYQRCNEESPSYGDLRRALAARVTAIWRKVVGLFILRRDIVMRLLALISVRYHISNEQ